MKIKSLYKWQLLYMKNAVIIFYGIMYALYICMCVIIFALRGVENFNFTGMDNSSAIFVFVMGISFYPETIRFSLGNGVSRKTLFLSQLCSAGTLVVTMGILDVINANLFSLFTYGGNMFNFIFGGKTFSPFHLANMAENLVWTVSIYLMMSMLGFFTSTFFYRVGKLTKTIIIIGLCMLTFVVLPVIAVSIPAVGTFLGGILGNLWAFIFSSSLHMVLVCVIVSVVLAGGCYLLVRRAPMKTV